MMRILGVVILILIVVLPGCGPDPMDDLRFSYDERTGECRNGAGTIGYNEVDLLRIRETKDCECTKFSKIEVLNLAGDTIAIPQRLGYHTLTGYNFRGAVLDSCTLFFNHIAKADLSGADLSTLQYGYAFVVGRVDEFTKAPLEGHVEFVGDSVRCFQ